MHVSLAGEVVPPLRCLVVGLMHVRGDCLRLMSVPQRDGCESNVFAKFLPHVS